MLLAIRTRRGIQSVSGLNRSNSKASPERVGIVGQGVGLAAEAARPRREPGQLGRPLLLGQDIQGNQEALDQVAEQLAEAIAPGCPDVAELVGQRARRGLGRLAQQLDQRAWIARKGRLASERRLQGRAHPGGRAARRGQWTKVDQLAERGHGRVVGEDTEQDQLGQRPIRVGWLGLSQPAGKLEREAPGPSPPGRPAGSRRSPR